MINQAIRSPRLRLATFFFVCLLLTPALGHGQASAATGIASVRIRDAYDEQNKAALAARSSGDWASARRHASVIDSLLNGHPSAQMAVARASANLGDFESAVSSVKAVLEMGVKRDLAGDKDLASLRGHSEWASLITANDANARSIGTPRLRHTLPASDLIAEDIVYDPARARYLVSSVRKKTILSVNADGSVGAFVPEGIAGLSGMFGLALDSARGQLWATTVAMTHVEGFAEGDSARAAVLRFDLATGALQARYPIASTALGTVPGDITLSQNGDLYVSDSRSGIVHVIRQGSASAEVLVPDGTFMSPQGPALSRDGRSLFVADYLRGVAQVNLATGAVRWMRSLVPLALNGIDGLYLAGDSDLVAVQNGVAPNRIMLLTIDQDKGLVTAARVLAQDTATIRDPTHGVLVGGEFVFIGNSGWDEFDGAGVPVKDRSMARPAIRTIGLRIEAP
jgi:sugar lactone lactonase YvrE